MREQSQGYSFMTTSVPPTTLVEVPFSPQLGKSSSTVLEATVVLLPAASVGASVEMSPFPTITYHEERYSFGVTHHVYSQNYLKGQSHEIFCTRFFPLNSSSWSH